MTYVTLREAAEQVDRSATGIRKMCAEGRVRSKKGPHPRRKNTVWLVDIDALSDYIGRSTGRPRTGTAQALEWSPVIISDNTGDLTLPQQSCIANEPWHDLVDIQPDDSAPGAVRVWWSDGESFAIYPNGDTGGYYYDDPRRRAAAPGNAERRRSLRDRGVLPGEPRKGSPSYNTNCTTRKSHSEDQ